MNLFVEAWLAWGNHKSHMVLDIMFYYTLYHYDELVSAFLFILNILYQVKEVWLWPICQVSWTVPVFVFESSKFLICVFLQRIVSLRILHAVRGIFVWNFDD